MQPAPVFMFAQSHGTYLFLMSGGGNFICSICSCPQTKFAKVIFLHPAVCSMGGGREGVWLLSMHREGSCPAIMHQEGGVASQHTLGRGDSASKGVCLQGEGVCIHGGLHLGSSVHLEGLGLQGVG